MKTFILLFVATSVVLPGYVRCTVTSSRDAGSVKSYGAGRRDFCATRSDGIYKGEVHCHHFVMCSSGSRIDFHCPDRMSFDARYRLCMRNDLCVRDEGYDGSGDTSGDAADDTSGDGPDPGLLHRRAQPVVG